MNYNIEELTDKEYYNKYGMCKEDVKIILWENSENKVIWDYTHR